MDILNSHLPLSITTQSNYKLHKKNLSAYSKKEKFAPYGMTNKRNGISRSLMLYLF